jgi:hypothetical protein
MDGPPWLRGGGGIVGGIEVIVGVPTAILLNPIQVQIFGTLLVVNGLFHIARSWNLSTPKYSDVPRWKWQIPLIIAIITTILASSLLGGIALGWPAEWQTWAIIGSFALDGLVWLWWGSFIGFSPPTNNNFRWLYVLFGSLEIVFALLALTSPTIMILPSIPTVAMIGAIAFGVALTSSGISLGLYWYFAKGRP